MPTNDRARLLADFKGIWVLDRDVEHGDGTTARFQGQAVWTPRDDGLEHCERGELQINGHSFHAERRYFWDRQLRLWFDDGRFFHQVPPMGGSASHWCDPDHYFVDYDFSPWPEFDAFWRVRGPKKDYVMRSRYRRAG